MNLKVLNLMVIIILLTLSCSVKNKTTILLGYWDGVIGGAEIEFYDDNTFEYCSSSFLYKKCHEGIFIKNDTSIILKYNGEKPRIKSERLKIEKHRLIFLDENDKQEYQFYIESQYLD